MTIFVSSGAISVPDVVGDARRAAVTELKRAGFVVAVDEQPTTDPAQDGLVTNQFPAGGGRAGSGATWWNDHGKKWRRHPRSHEGGGAHGGISSEHEVSLRSAASVAADSARRGTRPSR